MHTNQLTIKQIHGSDPLAKIFSEIFSLKPYGVSLFFIFAGLLYGYVIPRFLNITPAKDLITIINIILVFPMAGYFYAYQPNSILRIYHSVSRFLKEEGDAAVPFEKLRKWHAKPIWWIIGILIGLISAGFGVAGALDGFGTFWYNANWAQMSLVFGVRFLAMSIVGMIVTRHIATSMALNDLFQYAQFPLTLNTDKIEVFSAVKRFSFEIIGVAAIIGLNLGLQPLVIQVPLPEYAFYVVMYFILVPLTFFLPLWEAHRRMVAIKTNMLDKLHKDFQEESDKLYEIISKDFKKDLSNSYVKQSENLISIKKAIELINDSPDWPFQGTSVYQLLVTLISPFLLAIGNVIMDFINNYF